MPVTGISEDIAVETWRVKDCEGVFGVCHYLVFLGGGWGDEQSNLKEPRAIFTELDVVQSFLVVFYVFDAFQSVAP